MVSSTVQFSRQAANVFLHVLTRCNLRCRHCYINPEQHGRTRLPIRRIERWLAVLAGRSPGANLVLLGGEPTLHPDLPRAVRSARRLGYGSVTIDTNGYLFHDILEKLTPRRWMCSASAWTGPPPRPTTGSGAEAPSTPARRDPAGAGQGVSHQPDHHREQRQCERAGRDGPAARELGVERFFIQVLGLRGKGPRPGRIGAAAGLGVRMARAGAGGGRGDRPAGHPGDLPQGVSRPGEKFECAGLVADNYFVFPNGRVYRCPLCEDYPLHSLAFEGDRLVERPKLNEEDLFRLDIPEGCVMHSSFSPARGACRRACTRIACCLLKQELPPG
jgi:Fe-coproporphyrin III synthase